MKRAPASCASSSASTTSPSSSDCIAANAGWNSENACNAPR